MNSQIFFKVLAKVNKWLLPSLTRKRVDLAKATKLQMALFGWRLYVTKKALD
ncbi:SsrA-binding protein [bacterium]|nr:SsrA-binding protein [bacterium]